MLASVYFTQGLYYGLHQLCYQQFNNLVVIMRVVNYTRIPVFSMYLSISEYMSAFFVPVVEGSVNAKRLYMSSNSLSL